MKIVEIKEIYDESLKKLDSKKIAILLTEKEMNNFYLSDEHLEIIRFFACKTSDLMFFVNNEIVDEDEVVSEYFRDSFNAFATTLTSLEFDENEIRFDDSDSIEQQIYSFLEKRNLDVIDVYPANSEYEEDFYDDFANLYLNHNHSDFKIVRIVVNRNSFLGREDLILVCETIS